MRYLKKYEIYVDSKNVEEESDLLKKYTFKIGELVKVHNDPEDLCEIIAINTEDIMQPYLMSDGSARYWMSGAEFSHASKEEIDNFQLKNDANKYNL